jgi:hypothetical protein
MSKTYGPDFNGVVRSVPDRSSAEPENQAEALDEKALAVARDAIRNKCLEYFEKTWDYNVSEMFAATAIRTYLDATRKRPVRAFNPTAGTLSDVRRFNGQKPHIARPDDFGGLCLECGYAVESGFHISTLSECEPFEASAKVHIPDGMTAATATKIMREHALELQAKLDAAALQSSPPVKAAAVDGRLYDDDAPMADGEERMTAAENVLAWLIIEKIGVPDDETYTPKEAQDILARAIDQLHTYEAAALASQAAGEGEAVAEVLSEGVFWYKPAAENWFPTGTKLYTSPRPAAADAGVREDQIERMAEAMWRSEVADFPSAARVRAKAPWSEESTGIQAKWRALARAAALSLAAKREPQG